jgi:hypothetical protein
MHAQKIDLFKIHEKSQYLYDNLRLTTFSYVIGNGGMQSLTTVVMFDLEALS